MVSIVTGAVALNLIYGTYGLRNWIKRHTYIEDERAAVAWTVSQVHRSSTPSSFAS